jgi:predicted nuclease with TOPRIM domain
MKPIIKQLPLILGLSTGLFFNSCTNKEKEEAALKQVTVVSSERDSLENALVTTLDEINQNLDMIRSKQGLIANTNGQESVSKKEAILQNISMINALIADNQKKVEELTAQAKKLGKEKSAMARIAKQTKDRIEKQEQEIAMLKEQLAQESYKVEDLNHRMNDMQLSNEMLTAEKTHLTDVNTQMDKDLNKAYFTYGTSKELKSKSLVEKKGGVLGIGKKEALANAFFKNKSSFTEVDIRETKTIPIQGKKPKLITFHPEASYEIQESEDHKYANINIKNPDEFWSASKYLVVEVR